MHLLTSFKGGGGESRFGYPITFLSQVWDGVLTNYPTYKFLLTYLNNYHILFLLYLLPRIAYNVFNMDKRLAFIAKLPLIIGGFFELG